MVNEFTHGKNFDAAYMGDDQLLPNGNVFVGWGSQPYFSEYSQSGQLILDASLPSPDLSYRATVDSWVGLPEFPPQGAARTSAGRNDGLCQLERGHRGFVLEGTGRHERP